MLGTFSLEHTNFINSGLTWKGSKGNRSSSRQAEKSVSRSLKACRELFNQNLKTVDMPVCESKKLGVSVLGGHFTEKAEHVPIKKRRFVYRSPSPPPRTPSPHPEKTDMVLKIKPGVIDRTASANDLGPIVDKECYVDETILEKEKVQVNENEDFLGISMLAAAACSKDFGGEEGHVEYGSGIEETSVCDSPFECATNSESLSLSKRVSKNDLNCAKISTKGAVVQDHPMNLKDLLSSKDKGTIRKQGSSSRDDRLHWDLNRAMDSWERLSEYRVADSNTNVADRNAEDVDHSKHCDKMRNFKCYELPSDPGDSNTDAAKDLPPSDFKEVSHERKQLNIENHKLSVSACSERSNYMEENLLSSELDHAGKADQLEGQQPLHSQERIVNGAGFVIVLADDAKKLSDLIDDDESTSDHTVSSAFGNDDSSLHGVVSLYLSEDNKIPYKSHDHKSSYAANADMFTSSSSQLEKKEVACLVPSSCNTTGVVGDGLKEAVADVKEICGSLAGTSYPVDIIALEAGQTLEPECIDNFRENQSCSAPQSSEIPTSAALIEDQPALAVDLEVQHGKASVHGSVEMDTLVHTIGEEPATKCMKNSVEMLQAPSVHSSHSLCRSNCDDLVNSSDRMIVEEPLDDYNSDVPHDHAHVKSSDLEVDYDSQYEDGEVRESIVHTWEVYDGEDMEVEHVDYGSDSGNNLSCEAEKSMKHAQETNFQSCLSGSSGSGKERSFKGQEGMDEVESGKVTRDAVAREVEMQKSSLSAGSTMKISRRDHRKFSDSMIGLGDGSSRKNLASDNMDVMAAEGTKMRMVGSREFRRELQSHTEGRALQDQYFKKGQTYMQGISDTDNTYPRYERVSGYVEPFGRVRYTRHARGEEGHHWVNSADSHRGIKRYRSPHYHVPASFRRPGPENGSIARQNMDASSLSVHQRLIRSGSPADDRYEAFRLRLGFRPSRELSPGRRMTLGRGRSLRYGPQLDGRGLRGRYHRSLPDDCSGPSLNHSHPPVNRDRSSSPIERRGKDSARNSHSKSPPISRLCSSDSGNPSSAHRSESPSFRSEVRMQRGRSPHQRSGFMASRIVRFPKMRRNHGSPPRNSRSIGNSKDGLVHFREQARFGPREGRFDFLDSPRNYRSVHTGRLLEMEGIDRGRPRCDGSDDNREKHGHRFGLVPPAKQYDVDGAVKQFPCKVDEGFVKGQSSRCVDGANFYGRGSPKQFGRGMESFIGDGPRKFREERDQFIHQRDGKCNANPKSSRMREIDDDKASMRRPS